MNKEKKQPTRRSVKKGTEKSRAKIAQKAKIKEEKSKKEKRENPRKEKKEKPQKSKVFPERAVVDNPLAKKSKTGVGRKTKGDTNTKLRWPQVVFVVLLVLSFAAASLFAWDRWLRFDDAQDIQGEWIFTSEGNSVPVNIDADKIAFSSDVKFPYKIDTWGKIVEYNFTDLSGKGFYRFSADRQTLYISEGASEDIFVSIQIALGLRGPSEDLDLSTTTILTRQVQE